MKTAVEWYNLKVIELMKQREQGNIDVLEFRNQLDLLLEQAKEMEKEQIMNCSIQTTQDCYVAIMEHLNAPLQFTDEDLSNQKLEAEKYYNETFKSDKEYKI
jgi:hypothetical protein